MEGQAEAAGISTPPSPPSVYASAKSSPGHQQRAFFDEPIIEAASEPSKEAAVIPGACGTDLLASAMGLMGSRADGGQSLSGAGMGRQRSMLPSSSAKLAHVMLRVQETPQKVGSSSLAALPVLAMTQIHSLLRASRMQETPLPSGSTASDGFADWVCRVRHLPTPSVQQGRCSKAYSIAAQN